MDKHEYYAKLNEITEQCADRAGDLLTHLGIEYKQNCKRLILPCPIHLGDNRTAVNVYPNGHKRFHWECYTRKCSQKYGDNLFGFVRGVLTTKKRQNITFGDTLTFLLDWLGYKSLDEIKIPDKKILKKRESDKAYLRMNVLPEQKNEGWTREQIRGKLKGIPDDILTKIGWGYSKEILSKYDVGFSNKLQKIIVPIFNNDNKLCVGWMERAIDDSQPKWRCSDGFEKSNYLYNYWFAKDHLYSASHRTDSLILTEGCGDVWKLEMHNIHNAVALFGLFPSAAQITQIQLSRALSLLIFLDNDEAGRSAVARYKEIFGRQFRLYFLTSKLKEGTDVGNLESVDAITEDIENAVKGIRFIKW